VNGVQLASIVHPWGTTRIQARERARMALRELVASTWQLELARITLACTPGSAPRLLLDGAPTQAGVSLAHEGLLSLAAFHADGAVGVDVMRVQLTDDWHSVARDYLGPAVAAMLDATPPAARAQAFARAWTAREACLKCLGLGLSEWTALPDRFDTEDLDAAPGYVGTLAVRQRPGTA
jgi:4'-phosphopantetheinyl transferase